MKKIEGNLRIEIGDTRDFSQLEEVTGYVDVQENAKFTAPVLATVTAIRQVLFFTKLAYRWCYVLGLPSEDIGVIIGNKLT